MFIRLHGKLIDESERETQWRQVAPEKHVQLTKIIFGIVGLLISALLVWTAWWFIETITLSQALNNTSPESNFWLLMLNWILPFGLLIAAIIGAIGALFVAMRHSRAIDMLVFSCSLAAIFLVVTLVNVVMVINHASLSQVFSNIWQTINQLTSLSTLLYAIVLLAIIIFIIAVVGASRRKPRKKSLFQKT